MVEEISNDVQIPQHILRASPGQQDAIHSAGTVALLDEDLVQISVVFSAGVRGSTVRRRQGQRRVSRGGMKSRGGLMLLWRKDVNLVIHSFSSSHIDAGVFNEEGIASWRFTGIYGQPKVARREETWRLLWLLNGFSNQPWLSAGDLNEILHPEEKTGAPRSRKQIEDFRSCLSDCQLYDLGYKGDKFTWCNRWEAPDTVHGIPGVGKSLGLKLCGLNYARCEDVIRQLWSGGVEGSAGSKVLRSISSARIGLVSWDKLSFGHVHREGKHNGCMEIEVRLTFMPELALANGKDEDIDAVIRGMETHVSDEMNEALLQPFSSDEILGAKFNYTYIVLIPKCPKPESMNHFRPISLCNITYKIASKVLANRMKPLLSSVISESQSAFVPGRLITDNVLVAYEINHYLAHKYGSAMGYTALKLDLSKAYDRVEWIFLARHLAISSLRPRLMEISEQVLVKFEKASGLQVNLEKSSIVFSRNTPMDCREELATILGVQVVGRHDKYLGLPAVVGRSKKVIFQNLKDNVWTRLQSWKCKNLSQAGKVVLLKSVVQSTPVFAMSCFLVPHLSAVK
ncbi:UNVERIFIED_CONTAM: hypothetical protein Slati_4264000 [Sesamum latifolium]|uniref:Reverse transcriptase domain-containing protein n=1 Tax=Sesamum latifolium TaxID=2727402 RepID=A0AAW2TF93_9LAMI